MNKIGRLFQVNIYGESHGSSVGCLIDGIPAGIKLDVNDFEEDLLRRRSGALGTTLRKEADEVIIESGIFNGYTTGAPILLQFKNTNASSKDYSNIINHPRPSHADFVASNKYNGFNDYRGGGAFSGRLTLGVVAAGVIAKKILKDTVISSEIRCLKGVYDRDQFKTILEDAIAKKDSVGGIISIKVENTPIGLGEPYFDSLESTISHLLFSIGGVKGVEFGLGFEGANLYGSEYNDLIINKNGKTKTNNNGGINGGISNGNDIDINVFVKPTPSIGISQETYNFKNDKVDNLVIEGRHDAAIILRAQVVLEAAVAIALADAKLINKAYK
jgi:chorismate synthase